MLNTYEKNSKAKLVTTIVAVLVIAGIVILADHFKSEKAETARTLAPTTSAPAPAPANNSTTTTPSTSSNSNSNSSAYKDGTYTASSSYFVPHGQEDIQVNLTLQNGTITAASIQNSESNGDSAMFQENFASSYKQYVVGKKISGLQVDTIAGASDTTQGFNEALRQIASKAQA